MSQTNALLLPPQEQSHNQGKRQEFTTPEESSPSLPELKSRNYAARNQTIISRHRYYLKKKTLSLPQTVRFHLRQNIPSDGETHSFRNISNENEKIVERLYRKKPLSPNDRMSNVKTLETGR